MAETGTRTRRRGRTRDSAAKPARRVNYTNLKSTLPLATLYSEDQIAAIHDSALTVLEELGVRVVHDGARAMMAKAGATVREDHVRFDRAMIEAAIQSAPRQFTLTGAEVTQTIGGRHTQFLPVGGPPHAMDTERGKRPGTFQDFRNFIRLAQHFDAIHMTGPSVEPQDIPTNLRHLEMTRVQMLDSTKPTFIFSRGAPQVRDCIEILCLRHGLTREELVKKPYTYTVINTNSPLILDTPMCQGLIDFASLGQICIITPFTLSGAMAPVTIPGALVQQHAEMLSALLLTQIVRPGAPVVYGGFTSNVDMKSGAPAFGTPEYVRACWGTGQLARMVGLPWRSSASCASNAPDAQAIWETQMALWGALTGGANVVLHAAGWLEGGLSASYEKFILDIEQIQHMAELMQPVPFDAGELALEAIREVGSGGHYFGAAHTMERYQTAFYAPYVSDWSNYGQWQESGSQTATERAHGLWKKVLAEFELPKVDVAVRAAIDDFVERRKAEGGAHPES
ncbi:MAG: trimethylamine methyltransferase family protein [Pseudomonadota bacterium]